MKNYLKPPTSSNCPAGIPYGFLGDSHEIPAFYQSNQRLGANKNVKTFQPFLMIETDPW